MKPKNEKNCASFTPATIPWFVNWMPISPEHSLLFMIIFKFLTSLAADIKTIRNRGPRMNPKTMNLHAEICRNCLISDFLIDASYDMKYLLMMNVAIEKMKQTT